jgi:hypothetical protein
MFLGGDSDIPAGSCGGGAEGPWPTGFRPDGGSGLGHNPFASLDARGFLRPGAAGQPGRSRPKAPAPARNRGRVDITREKGGQGRQDRHGGRRVHRHRPSREGAACRRGCAPPAAAAAPSRTAGSRSRATSARRSRGSCPRRDSARSSPAARRIGRQPGRQRERALRAVQDVEVVARGARARAGRGSAGAPSRCRPPRRSPAVAGGLEPAHSLRAGWCRTSR